MKSSTPLKQANSNSYLKVVNNVLNVKKTVKKQVKRIYINTLVPNFTFTSSTGEIVMPNRCIPL